MLNVVMLSVATKPLMLNVILLSVVMLNVVSSKETGSNKDTCILE